jgi:hypothetical protein
MSWGTVGKMTLLAGSLFLGILMGLIGYWIFESKVPAAMQTAVLATEAKVYYIVSGFIMGLLIFAWTLIAAGIAGRAGVARGSKAVSVK